MEKPSFSVSGGPTPSNGQNSSDSENRPEFKRKTSSFFPWSEPTDESTKFTFSKLRRFPILGAAGLFGSLCTIALSAMTLHFFDKQPVEERAFRLLPKPAAFLSVILSLNTLMVHLAISQGMAVSWWVRASHKNATVKDMHNTWAAGSIIEALLAWKAFNYVALATVIVATLPVNGVLLQNALTSFRGSVSLNPIPVDYNFANRIPINWTSGSLNGDGSVGVYDNKFANILSDVMARNFSDSVITKSSLTNCNGTCTANLTGLGFSTTCLSEWVPYNMLNLSQWEPAIENTTRKRYLVLSIDVIWDYKNPNTMLVNVLDKPYDTCTGDFLVTNCTLQMGPEYYSTRVVFNSTGSNVTEHAWSHYTGDDILPFNGYGKDWKTPEIPFTPYPVLAELEPRFDTAKNYTFLDPLIPHWGTRFGGIAAALKAYYKSSVIVQYAVTLDKGATAASLLVDGQFTKQRTPYSGDWYSDGQTAAPTDCSISFDYDSDDMPFNSTVDDVLSGIKSTFFFTSIMLADTRYVGGDIFYTNKTVNWDVVQDNTPSSQTRSTVIYNVRWKWWFASLGVTIGVIIFVLPTFWGFWTLSRRTTLSPFETARAFRAPVIYEAPPHLNTKELLKTVGNKNLHTDLHHQPIFIASPQALHHGYNAPVGYFPDQQSPPSQYPPQQYSTQPYPPQQSVPQQYANQQSPQQFANQQSPQQFSTQQSPPVQSPPQANYDMPIQPLPPQGYKPMPYPGT